MKVNKMTPTMDAARKSMNLYKLYKEIFPFFQMWADLVKPLLGKNIGIWFCLSCGLPCKPTQGQCSKC
jgi:hypothetical protein